MVAFSHLDAGTSEAVWRDDLARRDLRPLDVDIDVLVVVAAHPDDETLGAGGLIARATRLGARTVVVVATDGEASHPDSPTHDPATLARLRREEVREAIAFLAPAAHVVFLGLPDGGLDSHRPRLRAALDDIVRDHAEGDPARVLIAAPWAGDHHRDHRIVAEEAASVTEDRGLGFAQYPVWAWHWGTPSDLPWDEAVALTLSRDERDAKRAALAAHVTQTAPLSDQPGDEAVLHAGMQEHFDRAVEVFFVAPRPPGSGTLDAQWFDDFYRRNGDDPWGFASRWYEERKRAVLLSALPTRDLGRVFEIGCAGGLLTREIAPRAREVVAMDAAAAPVAAAGELLRDTQHVSVRQGGVPRDWPEGRFDTIVLSEVGYYLSPADLQETIARAEASLTADGCLVACHWRHPVAEYPQSGDDVHEALRAHAEWESMVLHVERDFVLEVFVRPPAQSVAEREGLL